MGATATQIITSVPLAAGTGNVTVNVKGNMATGPSFAYQQAEVVSTLVIPGPQAGIGVATGNFRPAGLATDAAGNIYVADKGANVIRKITPQGAVSVFAGGAAGTVDGTGTAAGFIQPTDLAFDSAGNLFVCDNGGLLIRKITPSGVVTTFAGNGRSEVTNGTGTAASFSNALGIAIDGSDNIFVADQGQGVIRKITPNAIVTTYYSPVNDGTFDPYALAVDKAGNIYVVVEQANAVEKISTSGQKSLFAGGNFLANHIDGTANAAAFNNPYAITIDANGNLYVLDSDRTIRKITPAQVVTTFSGGEPTQIDGPIATVTYQDLYGIAFDSAGNIYLSDNGEIRKISFE